MKKSIFLALLTTCFSITSFASDKEETSSVCKSEYLDYLMYRIEKQYEVIEELCGKDDIYSNVYFIHVGMACAYEDMLREQMENISK